jgi:hypothetical protein
MPVIYCLDCGAKHSFVDKKPSSCAKCRKSLNFPVLSLSATSQAKEKTSSKEKSFKDPRLEKKRALLLKRRGRSPVDEDEEEADEDEDFDDDLEDSLEDIPRPSKLAASIEVDRPKSIASMGNFLKSINPDWGKES